MVSQPQWAALDSSFVDRYVIDALLKSLDDVTHLLFGSRVWNGVIQVYRLPANEALLMT